MAKEVFNVVVVDDEQSMEMLFKAFFDEEIAKGDISLGYASSGDKALSVLDKGPVDLFLCDINMPYMNGYEFLDALRERGCEIPVFMISAYGSRDYISKALEKGAKEFFVKPFDFDEVKKKVEQISLNK